MKIYKYKIQYMTQNPWAPTEDPSTHSVIVSLKNPIQLEVASHFINAILETVTKSGDSLISILSVQEVQSNDLKCVVAATDAEGSPSFAPIKLPLTEEYDTLDDMFHDGEYIDMARTRAEELGYENAGVVFCEMEGPDWLFNYLFPEG